MLSFLKIIIFLIKQSNKKGFIEANGSFSNINFYLIKDFAR